MAKLITTPIGSFTQAAVTTINANMDAIEVAIENTLSRDGTIPNQMAADIDLNNNDLLNVNTLDVDSITLGGEVLIPGDINSGTALEILNAIKTIDGAGSGLDADLLDGQHAAEFVEFADTSTVGMGFVIDEDNMASNLATKVPTQQSVKAYVDASHPGMTFDGTVPPNDGFFKDTTPATKIIRWQDRMFGGASSVHTGNKSPNPLGGSWLTERGANYFEKNAYFAVSTEEENSRIAILGAAWNPPGSAGTTVNGGIFGVSLVEDGFGRAIYAETMMKGTAVNSVGIEVQVGNYTAIDFNPNAYSVGGMCGLMLGAVGGNGYVLGDADTPQVNPTLPASCAVDISGGDTAATWQKWRAGIVFRDGALYRHIDGSTGNAKAISMARGHEISWAASSTLNGAVIRSDVTAVAGQNVGLIFANTEVKISGPSERAVAIFKDDTAGAGAVNWLQITNARTGVPNSIRAKGADASASIDVSTTGTGVIRFQSHDGAGEHLRVNPASQAVNFVSVTGGTAGVNPRLEAAGSDANRSLILRGKGTGGVRLEDGGSAAKIEVNTTGIGFFGTTPVARGALAAPTGTITRTTFDTATVTLPQLAERVNAIINDMRAYGLFS